MNYTVWINGGEAGSGSFAPDTGEEENRLVSLYPSQTDQCWDGFGGAVTDSCGYVWSQLSAKQQAEFLDACFGPGGLGYNIVRVPIDSCDFSLEQYEAAPDGDPAHFNMARPLKYILPMLEAIRARADISLMLSPWSPPAIFKTNGKRELGGRCKRERYTDWAEYICRYIREFTNRGFHVARISLQNEPHAAQTWDSCLWSAAEEREFLTHHMRPALERNGFADDVGVYIWDHNKERMLERSLSVLDGEGRDYAAGIAFHWYSGDHFDALRQVHRLFPEKKLLLSENCIEYCKYAACAPDFARNLIAHEALGDLANGANAFLDWNLLLDSRGGPNYVNNFCHAPFLYDKNTQTLRRQSIYCALWHFAHFIPPGSVRILTSAFSSDLETTAFRRPDGSLALIILNRGNGDAVRLRLPGYVAALELPGHSLSTVLIEAGAQFPFA